MKGELVIDSKGEVASSLNLDDDQMNELAVLIGNILQDVNSYMRMNNNETGELKKTTLRLGNNHEMRIVVGADQITAQIDELPEISSGGAM